MRVATVRVVPARRTPGRAVRDVRQPDLRGGGGGVIRRLRRRPSGWFAAAAVLAVLAAAATIRAASAGGPVVPVLVAATDLQVGSRVDESMVSVARVPAGAVLPGIVTSPGAVVGRPVTAPVARGEVLTNAAFGGSPGIGPKPLSPGERAVSVPLSAAGAAAAILVPGALVDVVSTPAEGAPSARVVVAAAEVLAITPLSTAEDAAATAGGAVLLRARSRDALRLSVALDLGRGVRLLARPFAEGVRGAAP